MRARVGKRVRRGRWLLVGIAALYVTSATTVLAQENALHTVSGMPLFIDGTHSKTPLIPLSPALLDPIKKVTTLADALRILGPAYIAPDDKLHIPHWHFQNGMMLTLWPQGGETLDDTVSVTPRPDCGVPAAQCTDLVLNRTPSMTQPPKRSGGSSGSGGGAGGSGGGGNSGGAGSSSLVPSLMKMLPTGH